MASMAQINKVAKRYEKLQALLAKAERKPATPEQTIAIAVLRAYLDAAGAARTYIRTAGKIPASETDAAINDVPAVAEDLLLESGWSPDQYSAAWRQLRDDYAAGFRSSYTVK